MQAEYSTVKTAIDAIEAEMKSSGLWQSEPLRPEQYDCRQAFAMDTMAYNQWLQFIFIPRVNEIVAKGGQFPGSSSVGAQAVREFDGMEDASRLVSLLSEFDALIGGAPPTAADGDEDEVDIEPGDAGGSPVQPGWWAGLCRFPRKMMDAASRALRSTARVFRTHPRRTGSSFWYRMKRCGRAFMGIVPAIRGWMRSDGHRWLRPYLCIGLAMLSIALPLFLGWVLATVCAWTDRRAEVFRGPVVETQQLTIQRAGRMVLYLECVEEGGLSALDRCRFKLSDARTEREAPTGDALREDSGRRDVSQRSLRFFQVDTPGQYRFNIIGLEPTSDYRTCSLLIIEAHPVMSVIYGVLAGIIMLGIIMGLGLAAIFIMGAIEMFGERR